MLSPDDFFDLSSFEHAAIFDGLEYVWQVLDRIEPYLKGLFDHALQPALLGEVSAGAYLVHSEMIYIGEGTVVEPGAYIAGPAVIGRNCDIRHGAYLRGSILMGDHSTAGHASELKNALLLDHSHAPHFAYVGDSVLGNRVNLGAGTKLSNLALTSARDERTGKRPTIRINIGESESAHVYDTGLAKLGAILGDDAQTGCNSVLNPGCLVGRRTLVYANVSLRKGYYGPDQVIKLRQDLIMSPRS